MTRARPERLVGMLLVLAIAAVVALGVAFATRPPAADPSASASGDVEPGTGPSGATEMAELVRVVDGDTIVVRIDEREERVRYIGIDAPELASPDRGLAAACGGEEAAAANARLLTDTTIVLERDVSDRDRFGRLLRHAWIEGDAWRLIGRELVAAGLVEARSYPPDTLRDDELDAAERAARARGDGIWGACAGR